MLEVVREVGTAAHSGAKLFTTGVFSRSSRGGGVLAHLYSLAQAVALRELKGERVCRGAGTEGERSPTSNRVRTHVRSAPRYF